MALWRGLAASPSRWRPRFCTGALWLPALRPTLTCHPGVSDKHLEQFWRSRWRRRGEGRKPHTAFWSGSLTLRAQRARTVARNDFVDSQTNSCVVFQIPLGSSQKHPGIGIQTKTFPKDSWCYLWCYLSWGPPWEPSLAGVSRATFRIPTPPYPLSGPGEVVFGKFGSETRKNTMVSGDKG